MTLIMVEVRVGRIGGDTLVSNFGRMCSTSWWWWVRPPAW